MSLIPNAPTLLQISTNDTINYKGVRYSIASVVSTTDSGGQVYRAVVTISVNSQTVTLNLSTADTILSNYVPDANGVQHANWKQTVNA